MDIRKNENGVQVAALADSYKKSKDFKKHNRLKFVTYYFPSIINQNIEDIKLMLEYPNESRLILGEDDFFSKLLNGRRYIRVSDLFKEFSL